MSHNPCNFIGYNYPDSLAFETKLHLGDVIMSAMASQITSLMNVYSTVYSGADQRKHQSSASLAFVMGIHRWPVNSPHKGPVTRKMFPFDDVILHGNSPAMTMFHVPIILFTTHAILTIQWRSDQQNEKKRTFVFQYIFISILWKFALSRDQ